MKKFLSFILISFVLFINFATPFYALAKESWYYTTDAEIGKTGKIIIGGFASKNLCLSALKSVHPSWNPSTECYLSQGAKILSFSPVSGKPGDLVKIKGSDLIYTTDISFNGVKAPEIITNSQNEIAVTVPSGATTGPIKITTKYNGVASSSSFTVNTDGLRWWFFNAEGQIMGPGLEETTGMATKEECVAKRDSYIKNFPKSVVKDCFQETVDYAKEQVAIYKKQGQDFLNKINNKDPLIDVNAKVDVGENKSVYNFLAPIAGINKMSNISNDPTCTKETGCVSNNIGTYLNIIFKLAIGVAAALAVIMLIINGITYMGDESIFKKTEAKSKMFSAIFGLLIALASWALLNTINPALTGAGGLKISAAEITLDPEVHGDTPHQAVDGKFCNGKYQAGASWASDTTERQKITAAGITVNSANCTKVGQSGCTSLAGLDTSGVIALKSKCQGCELVITGGTECWLHSNKTQHVPGSSIVDLRLTNSLVSYVDEKNNKTPSKGMSFPVFTKNSTQFMNETDHYHIIKW